jgi:hypothetical protein
LSVAELSRNARIITDLIADKGNGVSFVEIANALRAAGVDPEGDLTMYHGEPDDNVVIWINASEAFLGAVNDVLAAKAAHYRGTSVLTYVVDGRTPGLPVAKSLGPFKHPRWAPVAFSAGPAS